MRIGELASQVGTTTRTLRFYEAQGLLDARRTSSGYRDYGEQDIRLVAEILRLRELGFSLDDTRPFVECLRAGNPTGDVCPSSIEVYRRKLAEVDAAIARLGDLRAGLLAKLETAEPGTSEPHTAETRESSCQEC
jgi:DNA-binding transcriptional MerR regulator